MGDGSSDDSGNGGPGSTDGAAGSSGSGAAARPDPTRSGTGYPPERHFLRDLDAATWQLTAERVVMAAPLDDPHRNAAGTAALGFLAALVDIACAPVALIAGAPDWTATQDMSLHATGWIAEGPAVADARLRRAGRNTVVVGVDVYDGKGVHDLDELVAGIDANGGVPSVRGTGPTLATRGLLTFARIPRSASAAASTFDPAALVGQKRSMGPEEPVTAPMLERIGLEVVDAGEGVVEIARSDYVRNSFGTINGGVLGAVFQGAAEAMCPGLVATDLSIHYLSQVQEGPARTVGSVSRRADGHAVVTLEAVDAGHRDQLLDLATVTLQTPPT
jgi:acyl-coenzyme A thioesterase PaaI-like protein